MLKFTKFTNFIPNILNNHLKFYPTPVNLNYNWSFGALAGIFLVIQLVSGFFLSIHYIADIDVAFESVEYIMREVNYGWLMRYSHANSASFFFISIYAHIFRSIFYKSYLKPHNKVWNSGVLILILSIVVAFIGYVLPWGQMSFWGATVITNLLSAIPVVGFELVRWVWGGFTIQGATLTRFYSLHYILAIVLVIAVLVHLTLLHKVGSSNPTGLVVIPDGNYFYRPFYLKDYFVFSIMLYLFLFITFFHPDLLGHPDNYIKANPLVTPTHIVPEWYFSPFYAILRSIDNKLLGVIAMLASILILLFLPYCSRIVKNSSFIGFGFILQHVFFYLFSISIIILWFVGGLPAEYPYIQFGKVFTLIYFSSFFINFILGYLETRIFFSIIEVPYHPFQKAVSFRDRLALKTQNLSQIKPVPSKLARYTPRKSGSFFKK